MGLYALADALHLSAPIAVVVAGLFVGNQGRAFAMTEKTREHVDTFWELVDEILNVVLFLLIGLELLVLPIERGWLVAGVLAIPIVLAARWLSVAANHRTPQPGDGAIARSDCGPHLGRIARGHLGGHGAVAAGQLLAQSGADSHLLRGGVLDPCPGLDGGPGHSDDQRPDGGPSVFFRTLMAQWMSDRGTSIP